MTYTLRTSRGKTILRTPSVRRLQTEIAYRFGEESMLRRTPDGYTVLRVEPALDSVRGKIETVRARVVRERTA